MWIGIGSNIRPAEHLARAARLLRERFPEIVFSHVYLSKAMHREDQDDFLNAAARFETNGTPQDIAAALREIEEALKKQLPYRFGPRTIDLDLLLFDDRSENDENLTIPHPRFPQRRFVVLPLSELLPREWRHPVSNEDIASLLDKTKEQSCVRENAIVL